MVLCRGTTCSGTFLSIRSLGGKGGVALKFYGTTRTLLRLKLQLLLRAECLSLGGRCQQVGLMLGWPGGSWAGDSVGLDRLCGQEPSLQELQLCPSKASAPVGQREIKSGEQTGGSQPWEGVPPGGASGVALEEDSSATGDPPVWSEKELSLGKAGAMMEHRQLDLSLHGTPTLNRYTVLGSRR